jgi:hypothetical protein
MYLPEVMTSIKMDDEEDVTQGVLTVRTCRPEADRIGPGSVRSHVALSLLLSGSGGLPSRPSQLLRT